VAATYPQLPEIERKYGSVIRGLLATRRTTESEQVYKSLFVTLPNGMSELIDTMADRLRLTSVHLSSPVVAIDQRHAKLSLYFANGQIQSFDKVVFTGSSLQGASMLEAKAPELARELRAIPHVSTATVNLWYDTDSLNHPMQGYGFVIPSDEQRFISAVTWTSSKHYGRAPSGVKLLRAYVGRDGAELDLGLSDSQIVDGVCEDLRRTMGIRAIPCGYIVRRWPQASPQYRLGHLDRLSRIDDLLRQWPGLLLCGASYRGVGIPDCIDDGQRMADRLLASLGTKDRSK
jgi:oxygen-dependent protoporphyrinogen oxidase